MKQYLIIGNSAAGIAAIEAIRAKDNDSKLTVISDEEYSAYCRCLISYYLAGGVTQKLLSYRSSEFYKDYNVELILKKKVTRIDPKKGRVICEDKTQLNYDSLLIATGASPKFPDIKGIKKKGVFGFRTLKDAQDIEGLLPITKTACILGGGLIGLKAAYALRKRNIEVKVIIKSNQVLSQILDFEAASFVQRRLEENGIELILGQDVTEVIGNGDVKAVKLESGKVIATALVVVGKSVSPNVDLIKDTNIKVNEGIVADAHLQSSISNIYTAGDVCESFDITLGKPAVNALWPIAVEQGKAAGANMRGESTNYEGSIGMNSTDFFGLPIVSMGMSKVRPVEGIEEIKISNVKQGLYKKVVLKNGILLGAIFVGDIQNSGVYLRLIREKVNVTPIKEKLLAEGFGYPDIIDLIKEKEKMYV